MSRHRVAHSVCFLKPLCSTAPEFTLEGLSSGPTVVSYEGSSSQGVGSSAQPALGGSSSGQPFPKTSDVPAVSDDSGASGGPAGALWCPEGSLPFVFGGIGYRPPELSPVNTYEGTHDVHALILGRAQTGIQAFK